MCAGCKMRSMSTNEHAISRRTMLGTLGVLGAAAATGAMTVGAPQPAAAQQFGQQENVQDALKRLFGARPIKDGSALVKLDIPLIAENGAVVPVSVEVQSPMTPQSYVKGIYVIADKNRIPVVTHVALTPEAGQAYIGENIRLGETGDVRAIVEQNDGTLLAVKREVKVTVGGCGG
jgi:sulfur-oxidizing protein SoxY